MRHTLYTGSCMAIGLVLAAAPAAAREWHAWCGDPGSEASLGWHFYCDRAAPVKPVEPSEAETVLPPAGLPPARPSASEEIARMRHELEESRATAILEPTPENVAAYLYLQQVSLQRASTFSDVFRRVVWSTPQLDYTLTRRPGRWQNNSGPTIAWRRCKVRSRTWGSGTGLSISATATARDAGCSARSCVRLRYATGWTCSRCR